MARLKSRIARFFGSWGVFFRGFLKHPVMVGSIIPSSRWTVDSMLSRVDWSRTRLFVEYGPGVGTFCQPVLDRLNRDAMLIVIDTNPDFIEYLRKTYHDSRFVAVHGSAADVKAIIAEFGFESADYILSGLPFSTLPGNLGPHIAQETGRAVAPGGAFLVYQFRPRVRDFIAPHFDRIETGFAALNIPPCFLYWAHKDEPSPALQAEVETPADRIVENAYQKIG